MVCHTSDAPRGYEPCQGFQRRLRAFVRSRLFAPVNRPQFPQAVEVGTANHLASPVNRRLVGGQLPFPHQAPDRVIRNFEDFPCLCHRYELCSSSMLHPYVSEYIRIRLAYILIEEMSID